MNMKRKPTLYAFIIEKDNECRTIFIPADSKGEARKVATRDGWKIIKRTAEDKEIEKRVKNILGFLPKNKEK